MSDVKKVLTLVACACVCLMVATTASADFLGVKAVNKADPATDFQCTQGNGAFVPGPLTVCNVFAIFDNPGDGQSAFSFGRNCSKSMSADSPQA